MNNAIAEETGINNSRTLARVDWDVNKIVDKNLWEQVINTNPRHSMFRNNVEQLKRGEVLEVREQSIDKVREALYRINNKAAAKGSHFKAVLGDGVAYVVLDVMNGEEITSR